MILLLGPFNAQAIKSKCDKEFGCITSISQKDCKKGELLVPGITIDKCCPGCKGGKKFEESCSKSPCAPGLVCVAKKCTYDKCKKVFYLFSRITNLVIIFSHLFVRKSY